ncbi:methyltransferase domain-containing protein [Calothrix sp. UHCC 0171]|uniref:methyltransferase domain-containing protein n=1 Tax=Calothrix sp. UHCC 0171 TaxID=3110245 RepID=UPI002B1F30BA|nr:methyltransferase domain-containing protein [Calothrix sp. UHCC 0171]MEA5571414.1 methyltransferase domain-containing protein [Calothrix sp. UHCC 0171]
MNTTLYQQIQQFYDASSSLWEDVWGEHMHHGYYGADGTEKKERRQAQIDLIEEVLKFALDEELEGEEETQGEIFPTSPRPLVSLNSGCSDILDVGCGIGGSSLYLAGRFGAKVTGITLSPVQAERAKQRAREFGLGNRTNFQVADALNMPFADNSFDLIWSLESGEHMPDKVKFLQECHRVLKPGGTMIIVTWCHRPIDNFPLTVEERKHLEEIYRVYCLPYVISLPEYAEIARQLPLQNLRTADWSNAVAPFWNMVIDSTFSLQALWGLLFSGWSTIQGALSLGLMQRGYESGLIRFGLICGQKES